MKLKIDPHVILYELQKIRKCMEEERRSQPARILDKLRAVTKEARADFTEQDVGYPIVAADMTHVLLINDKGDIVKLKHEEVRI